MRRAATLWLVFLTALAATVWAVRPSAARRQAPVPVVAGKAVLAEVQGVATCASMACHHGNGPRGEKGSEYSTWATHDPHARAYSVLFDKRSQGIAKALARK